VVVSGLMAYHFRLPWPPGALCLLLLPWRASSGRDEGAESGRERKYVLDICLFPVSAAVVRGEGFAAGVSADPVAQQRRWLRRLCNGHKPLQPLYNPTVLQRQLLLLLLYCCCCYCYYLCYYLLLVPPKTRRRQESTCCSSIPMTQPQQRMPKSHVSYSMLVVFTCERTEVR
jgi:hypothetical protein